MPRPPMSQGKVNPKEKRFRKNTIVSLDNDADTILMSAPMQANIKAAAMMDQAPATGLF